MELLGEGEDDLCLVCVAEPGTWFLVGPSAMGAS